MEHSFILVYTPTFGFNPFRVYTYGSPINTAISVAIDGLVFSDIKSAHTMCDHLNGEAYYLEYLPEFGEVADFVSHKMWEYAEAMEDAYPCPFEDWGYRE